MIYLKWKLDEYSKIICANHIAEMSSQFKRVRSMCANVTRHSHTHNKRTHGSVYPNYLSHLLLVSSKHFVTQFPMYCRFSYVYALSNTRPTHREPYQIECTSFLCAWQIRTEIIVCNKKNTATSIFFSQHFGNTEYFEKELLVRISVDSIMSALLRISHVFGQNAKSMVNGISSDFCVSFY